jgi:hypothetical protein
MDQPNGHVNFTFEDVSLDDSEKLRESPQNVSFVVLDENLTDADKNVSQNEAVPMEKQRRTIADASIVSHHDPAEFLTEKYMEDHYNFDNLKTENVLRSTAHYIRKYYTPSPRCGLSYLYKRIPFIKWIQEYNVKEDFVKDLVAGLTVYFRC